MNIEDLKKKIAEAIETAIKRTLGIEPDDVKLIFPPNPAFGDFAFECFELAKKLQKSPVEIASLLASNTKLNKIIKKATAAGPYLNTTLSNTALFSVLEEALDKNNDFGKSETGKKEKVMVEYLGPNTNKPLHLGHARNAALGISLSNILKNSRYEVLKANIINDRGVHICKSMLAYQKWGENSTPESLNMKGDHFVGHWYVRYNEELKNNLSLENEVQKILQQWEKGDKGTLELWKKMNDWVYAGWKETYQKFGIEFDVVNYESETYKLGKDIIEKGLQKGVFEENENGAVVFNLPEKEFGLDKDGSAKKITVLRADGTSLYVTQDLGTAVQRFEKYNLDKLIYIVGSEQDYYFKCLFKILKSLGYAWAKNMRHLSYGIVTLPEGRMKSREGNVIDADDLISEMTELAKEEIKRRSAQGGPASGWYKIDEKEIFERAKKIGIGAIKFYFLRVGAKEDIEFNPKESISFDGFTGPYCQYAYARISSILRKAAADLSFRASDSELRNPEQKQETDYSLLGDNIEERMLIKKIIEFPDLIKKSALECNSSLIATSTFETAQLFNKFYQKHKVLTAETEDLKIARLALIQAVQTVIKNGLHLLGIETLERM